MCNTCISKSMNCTVLPWPSTLPWPPVRAVHAPIQAHNYIFWCSAWVRQSIIRTFFSWSEGHLSCGWNKLCWTCLAALPSPHAHSSFDCANIPKQAVKGTTWHQTDPLSFGVLSPPPRPSNRFTHSQTSVTNALVHSTGAGMWGHSEGKQRALGLCASKQTYNTINNPVHWQETTQSAQTAQGSLCVCVVHRKAKK